MSSDVVVDCVRLDGSKIQVNLKNYSLKSCGCGFGGCINYLENNKDGSVVEIHMETINEEVKQTKVVFKTRKEVENENQVIEKF